VLLMVVTWLEQGGHAVGCMARERWGQPAGAHSWAVGVGWACGGPFPPCVCHCSTGCHQGLLQGLVSRWLGQGELAVQLGTWQGVVVMGFRGSVSSVAELGTVLVSSVMWQQASKALAALWTALGSSGVCVSCLCGFPTVVGPRLRVPLFGWL